MDSTHPSPVLTPILFTDSFTTKVPKRDPILRASANEPLRPTSHNPEHPFTCWPSRVPQPQISRIQDPVPSSSTGMHPPPLFHPAPQFIRPFVRQLLSAQLPLCQRSSCHPLSSCGTRASAPRLSLSSGLSSVFPSLNEVVGVAALLRTMVLPPRPPTLDSQWVSPALESRRNLLKLFS
jgi:hypothetical protein